MHYATAFSPPLGPFWVVTTETGAVTHAGFGQRGRAIQRHRELVNAVWSDGTDSEPARQLEAYFAGERTVFDLELAPEGTPFQQQVWAALGEIPYGQTISYGELATRLGRPLGAQAVGRANGQNPIGVIVPCHRVVGADGALVGYAGGLDRKEALLRLEGAAVLPPTLFD
ncbi:MAG: methylated-DNA--[protein]-cysteine S-methyltransferase [Bacteroidota bacterium]